MRERGKAVALATSGNWAVNTALGLFVPPSFVNIQWRTYCIFGTFCLAMTVHVFFMFPETAGKTLEEIGEMFEGGKNGECAFRCCVCWTCWSWANGAFLSLADPSFIPGIGVPAWKTRKAIHHIRDVERGGSTSGADSAARMEKEVRGDSKVRDESSPDSGR